MTKPTKPIKWPQVEVKPIAPAPAREEDFYISSFALIVNGTNHQPYHLTLEDATALARELTGVVNRFLYGKGLAK